MTEDIQTFIFLPGAGGGVERDLPAFADALDHRVRFDMISYPAWQRYLQDDFSADVLIAELTAEVLRRTPTGPIRIMGQSIGGHFGYAVALRLQDMGCPVSVLYAIDSFMIESAQPSAGWQKRALAEALEMLRRRRFRECAYLIKAKIWRFLLRLTGGRLVDLLRGFSGDKRPPWVFGSEGELSMRLLLRDAVPWLVELDRNPVPLAAPTILIRTQLSACHDPAWRRRCPNIAIHEVPGIHSTLFEPENINSLRDAFMAEADLLDNSRSTVV